jgi:hypothetical protein
LVARGGRREDLVAVAYGAAQLATPLAEGVEHLAGVADDLADGALLGVQHLEDLGGVAGERVEVAERVGDVARAPAQGLRLRLHPRLERAPGVGVERAEDLVELDGRRHLAHRQPAVLGHGPRARGVARRQLDVRLAQQRLLAQDRPRVARHRRVALLELDDGEAAAGLLV